ncbi:polysaccharide deacetylase family protein [Segnochrobactraceae bacterium EtOH-i3]
MSARVFPRPALLRSALLAAPLLLSLPALAAPPAACWAPETLTVHPGERDSRRITPAERRFPPQPAAATAPVTGTPAAGVVRRVTPANGEKIVALTFDLCETTGQIAGYDGAVIDALRAADAPATFFPTGHWLQTHPERAAQMAADPRFELGNHSYGHANMHGVDATRLQTDLLATEAVLAANRTATAGMCPAATAHVENPGPRLYRFPYGSCSAESLKAANDAGAVVIQWDVVSGDPGGTSAKALTSRVVSQVKPGSIVVMHANGHGDHTAEAVPAIVAGLRAKGYRLVTVGELLASGTPVTVPECYINTPGDTAVYDRAAAARDAPQPASVKATPAKATAPAAGNGQPAAPTPH